MYSVQCSENGVQCPGGVNDLVICQDLGQRPSHRQNDETGQDVSTSLGLDVRIVSGSGHVKLDPGLSALVTLNTRCGNIGRPRFPRIVGLFPDRMLNIGNEHQIIDVTLSQNAVSSDLIGVLWSSWSRQQLGRLS